MSRNDDGDSNDQCQTSTGQSSALIRSNEDQVASGWGNSPKEGALDVQQLGGSK